MASRPSLDPCLLASTSLAGLIGLECPPATGSIATAVTISLLDFSTCYILSIRQSLAAARVVADVPE